MTKNALPSSPDVLAYADEAGQRGLVRDLKPNRDHLISVVSTLPVPAEHLDWVRTRVAPLYKRFVDAAPSEAKLHISDAFAPDNLAWRAVAEQVRGELFSLMHEIRLIVVYVARRCRVARERFGAEAKLIADAKAAAKSGVSITGGNRPSDELLEDDIMVSLALMLDQFAECEGKTNRELDELSREVRELALVRPMNEWRSMGVGTQGELAAFLDQVEEHLGDDPSPD